MWFSIFEKSNFEKKWWQKFRKKSFVICFCQNFDVFQFFVICFCQNLDIYFVIIFCYIIILNHWRGINRRSHPLTIATAVFETKIESSLDCLFKYQIIYLNIFWNEHINTKKWQNNFFEIFVIGFCQNFDTYILSLFFVNSIIDKNIKMKKYICQNFDKNQWQKIEKHQNFDKNKWQNFFLKKFCHLSWKKK